MKKKRRIIFLSAAALVILALTAWLIFKPSPPDLIYGGHRLSWWVSRADRSSGAWGTPPGLDSNAVPYLIQYLQRRDGAMRKGYRNLYPHLPAWLQSRLSPPFNPAEQRMYCCVLIGIIRPAARPAIPELIRMLEPDDDRLESEGAMYALSLMAAHDNDAVVETLSAAAKDKDPDISASALKALEQIDPAAARKVETDNPGAR